MLNVNKLNGSQALFAELNNYLEQAYPDFCWEFQIFNEEFALIELMQDREGVASFGLSLFPLEVTKLD